MIYILCAVLLNPLVCSFTTATKDKSVNLNLETVLEFDNKNLEKDVQIIDNVQMFLNKVRRVLDKSKGFRRSYNKDKITFIDFLENVLGLLVTYKDDELQELVVIIDEELRKYHYKGCKFYELLHNEKLRNFIGDTLEEMKDMSPREIRKSLKRCLKNVKSRDFGEKDAEFVNYVNSLYRAEAKNKMHNVFKRLEDFSKTSRRAHVEMVDVIRDAIRTIIFDHYSNLNANARKDFRLKLDKFFSQFSDENDRLERATMFSDLEDIVESTPKAIQDEEEIPHLRKVSNADFIAKKKDSSEENKDEKTFPMFKDIKFIIESTTRNVKRKGSKTSREKSSNTDVTLKYKISSEEDIDVKKGSISGDSEIIDNTTIKPIKRKRKPTREKTTPDNLKKKSPEKHKKKKAIVGDEELIDVTTLKYTKRKRHTSSHVKSTTAEVTPSRKYSSEEEADKKGSVFINVDSDDEATTISSSSPTTEVTLRLYPVRDLEEEKNRMPLKFVSLYPESFPTATTKLRSRKNKKSKKHKRSKSKRLKTESEKEPDHQSSKLKNKKHLRQGKVNKPETMMVVREDLTLRDVLTEHNAIIRVDTSQATRPTEVIVEKNKHRNKKHGRNSKPKHESFEMMPLSSESDTETKTKLRKSFFSNGLAIASFENNELEGHYLYRKHNGKDSFSAKRSDLRKKAKQDRESMKYLSRKAQLETDNDIETNKYKHKEHSNVTGDDKIEIGDKSAFREQDAKDIVTTTSSHVSDAHISEKQLKNVINNIDNNNETKQSMTAATTTNIHSTTVMDVSPQLVGNGDTIYKNIETTSTMASIPFWHRPKTTSVVVSSSSSEDDENDNETVFNPIRENKSNETELSSPTVVNTNYTHITSTATSVIIKSVVKSETPSENSVSSKSLDKPKVDNTVNSTTNNIWDQKSIRKTLEFVDDILHHQKNVTVANISTSGKDKEKISSTELKDDESTKNDGKKDDKAVTGILSKKIQRTDIKLNEIVIKNSSEGVMSTNKEIKKNKNTTTTKSTSKVSNSKTIRTTEVAANKVSTTLNKSKPNVTLTESKFQGDSNEANVIKDANPMDKAKTNKVNVTDATSSTKVNNTTSSLTTLNVPKGNMNVSNAGNITKAFPRKNSKINNKIDKKKIKTSHSPFKIDELDWENNRESSDLIYNWA